MILLFVLNPEKIFTADIINVFFHRLHILKYKAENMFCQYDVFYKYPSVGINEIFGNILQVR